MASTAVGPPVQPSARPSTLVTTAIPATSTAVASAQSSSTPTTIEPTPIQSDMPPTDTSIPTSGPFSNVFAYAVGISCVVLVIITFAIMWFLNRRARATGPATSETGHVEKDDMTDIETAA